MQILEVVLDRRTKGPGPHVNHFHFISDDRGEPGRFVLGCREGKGTPVSSAHGESSPPSTVPRTQPGWEECPSLPCLFICFQ